MSFIPTELIRKCQRCSRDLPYGALACENCHTLVNAEQVEQLGRAAKAFEAQGELLKARELWLKTLPLMPPDAAQAAWVYQRAHALEQAANTPQPNKPAHPWKKWLGPLAPLAVLLAKAKSLFFLVFKLKFLLSFASFIAIYWALYGWKFGVGFAVLIFVHEMGHFIDIKRRGLPAEMPVFLPGFGAYVRWQNLGVSLETRAEISLAGPFAGWLGATVCALLWTQTHVPVWAALAYTTGWLNVLNLTPVWMLDGGQAALALSKPQRAMLLAAALGMAWLVSPWFLVVAAGACWRLFTKDAPPAPSAKITAYYLALLPLLGLVMWIVPRAGFPR